MLIADAEALAAVVTHQIELAGEPNVETAWVNDALMAFSKSISARTQLFTEDGKLVADVEYASPRPRVVTVESSQDLIAFHEDPSGNLTETGSPLTGIASITARAERQFMRTKAIARMD